jgi:hypothetical protein
MRRWSMSDAPKDGRHIIGCTRVEGVEHEMAWSPKDGGRWHDVQSGAALASDLFIAWRRKIS